MHLSVRAWSRASATTQIQACFDGTELVRGCAERLAEQTNEVAVGAIANAARDSDDLHARADLVCGNVQPYAPDVGPNGFAGFNRESLA